MADEEIPVKRTQGDYMNMTHSIAQNHLQTEVKKSKSKSTFLKITDFLSQHWFLWLYYYLVNRFGPNHRYVVYPAGETGIYPIGETAAIAIAADWATDTDESAAIAARMGEHQPDYTIHLGDTYYVGAPHEIGANFTFKHAPWVRGSKGSFSLIGNHEMYARGIAYYKRLLPTMGLYQEQKYTGQHAAYFCLETPHWRILGLDTGYHSIGKFPFIEMLPWFAPDCHFDPQLMTWLKEVVKLGTPAISAAC